VKRISIALLAGLMMVAGAAQAAGKTGFYVGGGVGWTKIESKQSSDLLSAGDPCTAGLVDTTQYEDGAGAANSPCWDYYANNGSTLSDSAIGLDAFVGWEFVPNWSVELQYVWLGDVNRTDYSRSDDPQGGSNPTIQPLYASNEELTYEQEANIRAVNLAARYHWMMSPRWGLNFMAGWTYGKSEYEQSVWNGQPQAAGAPWERPPGNVKQTKNDNGYLLGFGATINTTEHTFFRIEYNYFGIDFDDTVKKPGRIALDVGYQF